MKYNKLTFILLAGFVLLLSSCEKEYEEVAKETPAPYLELIGDDPLFIIKGAEYTDPGIYAEEYVNGDTIPKEYEILGEVNTSIPGSYTLHYKVTNAENIPFYIKRTISIVDITGYDIFDIPVGTYDGSAPARDAGNSADVEISKVTTGIYKCSDLMGGFYSIWRGYGPGYAAPGVFVIDEDGSIRSELGFASAWGTDVEAVNPKFDPATNTISYSVLLVDFAFAFDITLTLK